MNLQDDMRVLDVGCGVGGPAREIVKFAGVNVVGLNNNDYQIQRATQYAEKEGLSHKLKFTKGDFMVWLAISPTVRPTNSTAANVVP
jgi:sterol 24-C-methyltransferase